MANHVFSKDYQKLHWFLLIYQSLDLWFDPSFVTSVSIYLRLLWGFALVKSPLLILVFCVRSPITMV